MFYCLVLYVTVRHDGLL